jgi:hypothetical protein
MYNNYLQFNLFYSKTILFYSKTITTKKSIFGRLIAYICAYKFCAQQSNHVHTGHTACHNVPKTPFKKSSYPEPRDKEELITVLRD